MSVKMKKKIYRKLSLIKIQGAVLLLIFFITQRLHTKQRILHIKNKQTNKTYVTLSYQSVPKTFLTN